MSSKSVPRKNPAFTLPLRRSALLTLLFLILLASPAVTADFTVTRFDDPVPDACLIGDCSLREAVIAANSDSAADRILLDSGIYSLTLPGTDEDAAATGDLDITEDLEIIGLTDDQLLTLIDATGQDRVFEVTGANTVVTFRRLWIAGGLSSDSGFALRVSDAVVVLEECEVTANTGIGPVSAVSAVEAADLTVIRSTIANNGGIGLSGRESTVDVRNSTLANNSGDIGWQVVAVDASIALTHATITGVSTQDVNAISDGTITFANTVVHGTCATDLSGTLTSLGGNYESPANTCEFTLPSDVNNAFAPGLEPLGDWGGPTSTRHPVPESPQLDNGLLEHCLPVDQRGAPRPSDGNQDGEPACDRGAVEFSIIFSDGFESGDTDAWQ